MARQSSGWLGFIIFIVICVWVYNTWIKVDYSKPWFQGTKTVLACKTPYYTNDDCYHLQASSDGKTISRLHFNNGGYFDTHATCVKAATGVGYNYDRFCTFVDNDDVRWDLMPNYANVN